ALDPIYSSGGTLAAGLVRELADCYGRAVVAKPVFPAPNPVDCTTVTPDDVQFLYSSIGSGAGQNALINNTPPTAVPGPGEPPNTSIDFPGYPYPAYNFSGSDAPLSAAQLTTYNTNV